MKNKEFFLILIAILISSPLVPLDKNYQINIRKTNWVNIPLIAVLYDERNFQGSSRAIIQDTRDLNEMIFKNKTLSIRIFKGPNWEDSYRIRLYGIENYLGEYIELKGGEEISDLSAINFSNAVSSVKIYMEVNYKSIE